tara:strand:- start:904 stop:1089 length:186 start_codon:yes stop_codon:yes gene_type:complete
MKKFILITPFALLFGVLCFNANLEAAGCSSHKGKKNAQVECLSDDKCDNLKSDKNLSKVDT